MKKIIVAIFPLLQLFILFWPVSVFAYDFNLQQQLFNQQQQQQRRQNQQMFDQMMMQNNLTNQMIRDKNDCLDGRIAPENCPSQWRPTPSPTAIPTITPLPTPKPTKRPTPRPSPTPTTTPPPLSIPTILLEENENFEVPPVTNNWKIIEWFNSLIRFFK